MDYIDYISHMKEVGDPLGTVEIIIVVDDLFSDCIPVFASYIPMCAVWRLVGPHWHPMV